MAKWVYSFGEGRSDGGAALRNLLGGKGANLAEMSNLGLPVPPGFTITTEVCTHFYAHERSYPAELEAQVKAALAAAGPVVEAALAREDFSAAMTALAGLRAPVDAFFDKVTVNDSNPTLRVNRLRLLSRIRATLGWVADFTRIEG